MRKNKPNAEKRSYLYTEVLLISQQDLGQGDQEYEENRSQSAPPEASTSWVRWKVEYN